MHIHIESMKYRVAYNQFLGFKELNSFKPYENIEY